MEMRREPRCRVDIEPAAIVGVVREPVLDEDAELRQGARLARLPGVAQAFRPIRLGRQKLQGFEPVALGVGEAQQLRLRQRHARRSRGEARLPERREHAIGLAVAGDDRFRLEQQSPAEGTKLSPARAANLAYGLLQFRLPGLIAARDMDCATRRSRRAAQPRSRELCLDAGRGTRHATSDHCRAHARLPLSHQREAPPMRKRPGVASSRM